MESGVHRARPPARALPRRPATDDRRHRVARRPRAARGEPAPGAAVISAIVPTLGGAPRIARHLPSIARALAKTGEAWEIVVVNDGGGDLGAVPEGARLVAYDENRGYGPAVNAGAREARGEQILVLNDDVELAPDTVTRLRQAIGAPDVFAVVPRISSPLAANGDEGGKGGGAHGGLLDLA